MGKCENAKIIKLRKLEPSDLPFLYQWENDASVWADGSNHNPLSQQDLRDYIESTTGDIYKDGQLRLIIHSSSESVCQQSGLSGEAGLSSVTRSGSPYKLSQFLGARSGYIVPRVRKGL